MGIKRYSIRQTVSMKRNVNDMRSAAKSLCEMHKSEVLHQDQTTPHRKRMMFSLNTSTLVSVYSTQSIPPPFVRDELQDACKLFINFLTSFPKTPPPSHVVAELPTRSPLHEAFLTSCTKTPPPSHVVTELPTRRILHTAYSVAPPYSSIQCSAAAFMACTV